MNAALGEKDIIAEDLGFLTPSVHELLREAGYPGMKVLELASAPAEDAAFAKAHLRLNEREGYHWGMMRSVWASPADLAVVQFQDLLGLGSEARMNTPSTVGGNWPRRTLPGAFAEGLSRRLRRKCRCTSAFRWGKTSDIGENSVMARNTPKEYRNQVLCSVYVRNHSGESTLEGVRRDLERIRALGVDIIWLMPIHPVGVRARKGTLGSPYAISDYRVVNPEFGTLEDFRRLVDGFRCDVAPLVPLNFWLRAAFVIPDKKALPNWTARFLICPFEQRPPGWRRYSLISRSKTATMLPTTSTWVLASRQPSLPSSLNFFSEFLAAIEVMILYSYIIIPPVLMFS